MSGGQTAAMCCAFLRRSEALGGMQMIPDCFLVVLKWDFRGATIECATRCTQGRIVLLFTDASKLSFKNLRLRKSICS